MPTYQEPLHGVELSVALAEAASFASADVAILDTFEISHGGGETLYLVADYTPLTATTELGATVTFAPCSVTDELPKQNDQGEVMLVLTIFGLSLEGLDLIIEASKSIEPVVVKFRQYASDDLSAPVSRLPMVFELVDVPNVTSTSIQLRCSYGASNNRGFPRKHYTLAEYPTLVA